VNHLVSDDAGESPRQGPLLPRRGPAFAQRLGPIAQNARDSGKEYVDLGLWAAPAQDGSHGVRRQTPKSRLGPNQNHLYPGDCGVSLEGGVDFYVLEEAAQLLADVFPAGFEKTVGVAPPQVQRRPLRGFFCDGRGTGHETSHDTSRYRP
jgi:hypothetical protein